MAKAPSSRMLRIEFKNQPYDWFNLDEMGAIVKSDDFANTLRENIVHYFTVPYDCQAIFDEDGLLNAPVDFARSLQRMHPYFKVYDVREMPYEIRDQALQKLTQVTESVARSQRMLTSYREKVSALAEPAACFGGSGACGSATGCGSAGLPLQPMGTPRGVVPAGSDGTPPAPLGSGSSYSGCGAAAAAAAAAVAGAQAAHPPWAHRGGACGGGPYASMSNGIVAGAASQPSAAYGAPTGSCSGGNAAAAAACTAPPHCSGGSAPYGASAVLGGGGGGSGGGGGGGGGGLLQRASAVPFAQGGASTPPPGGCRTQPASASMPSGGCGAFGGGAPLTGSCTPPLGGGPGPGPSGGLGGGGGGGFPGGGSSGGLLGGGGSSASGGHLVYLSKDAVSGGRFGFANVPSSDGRSLLVTWVDDSGLLGAWNRSNPDRAVREGDVILSVNSFMDDSEGMRAELQLDAVCMAIQSGSGATGGPSRLTRA